MHRRLGLGPRPWWLLILVVLPLAANAFGVQGIEVQSSLNEPLQAVIRLVSVEPDEVAQIQVSLADHQAFARAGLARPLFLSKLQFRALLDSRGKPVISVTSKGSIREPYLDFLLRIEGGQGRVFKAFTILLDPPSYRPVRVSTAPSTEPNRTARPADPATSGNGRGLAPASYGPVKSSETLWAIAQKTRPSQAVSIYQMMIALQRQNPSAFKNRNINQLRQGVTLDIPRQALIEGYSKVQAKAEFYRQTQAWKRTKLAAQKSPVVTTARKTDSAPGRAPSAEKPRYTEPTQAGVEHVRLRVIEANHRIQARSADAPLRAYPASNAEVLREAIADSEHELTAVNEMKKSLDALQASLELKISTLQQAVNERDVVIDDLKAQIKTIQLGTEGTVDAGPASPTPVQERATVSAMSISAMASPTGQLAQPPVVTKQSEPASWHQPPWLAIGSIVVLLTLLAMLFSRRRSRSKRADVFQAHIDQSDEAAPKYERYIQRPGEEEHPSSAHQAAVDLALEVKKHPKDMDLKVMLFRRYAYMRDEKKFINLLEETHPEISLASPGLWLQVLKMGRELVPGHPLIATTNPVTSSVEVEHPPEETINSDTGLSHDRSSTVGIEVVQHDAIDASIDELIASVGEVSIDHEIDPTDIMNPDDSIPSAIRDQENDRSR